MVAIRRFIIIAPIMLTFEVFIPLKGPQVATFNETLVLNFEQGISISKVSEKHKMLRLNSSFLINSLKKVLFSIFFTSKNPLVATFDEMYTPTCRKYVVEQDMTITRSSEKHKLLHLHSSVFLFRTIASKMLILKIF